MRAWDEGEVGMIFNLGIFLSFIFSFFLFLRTTFNFPGKLYNSLTLNESYTFQCFQGEIANAMHINGQEILL